MKGLLALMCAVKFILVGFHTLYVIRSLFRVTDSLVLLIFIFAKFDECYLISRFVGHGVIYS
jgi:hypothetical protein